MTESIDLTEDELSLLHDIEKIVDDGPKTAVELRSELNEKQGNKYNRAGDKIPGPEKRSYSSDNEVIGEGSFSLCSHSRLPSVCRSRHHWQRWNQDRWFHPSF